MQMLESRIQCNGSKRSIHKGNDNAAMPASGLGCESFSISLGIFLVRLESLRWRSIVISAQFCSQANRNF